MKTIFIPNRIGQWPVIIHDGPSTVPHGAVQWTELASKRTSGQVIGYLKRHGKHYGGRDTWHIVLDCGTWDLYVS